MMKWFSNERKVFDDTCAVHKLTLRYDINREGMAVFSAIFRDREYADYFPFYEKAVVVDVGAHFGYFSLFASCHLDANSQIFALEPSPENLEIFRTNLFDSRFQNIKILPLALGHQKGATQLYRGSSINNSLISNYALNKNERGSVDVEMTSLSLLMADNAISHIDFLKLDCEGAEYEIILNSDISILQTITTISMEFHDVRLPGFSGNALVEKLRKAGFRIAKFHYDSSNMGLNFGKIIATRIGV